MPDLDREALERSYTELRWRQYAKDPALFFDECLFVPAPLEESGRSRFEMFDHQREDLEKMMSNRFVCVLKGRQIGLSTLVGALALWRCLFRPGSVILWVSDSQKNADKAVNALNVMWNYLPGWVRARAPEKTSKAAGTPVWTFPDGMTSRIRAYAGTSTAGASETAAITILDEFALVDGHLQEDLFGTVEPTTDAGGSLWVISTARGAHNYFAQTYRQAQKGESRFVPIFHPWMVSHFINPLASTMPYCQECGGTGLDDRRTNVCSACVNTTIYDAKSREFAEKPWKIHSEYPATEEEAFRESGNPIFRDLPLEEECETAWVRGFMHTTEDGKPEFVEEPTGPLRLREDVLKAGGPDFWRKHVMFIDPAEGVGGDYTAAHVLTWDDDYLPTIVAWWHDNTTQAVDAARELGKTGRWFQNALLAVETTGGHGGAMVTELNIHEHYPNLYVHTPMDSRRRKRGLKLGFPMTHSSRPPLVDRLLAFMRAEQQVGGIHPLLRNELATFVQTEKGRMEADVGCYDDLVMSLAGALWILVEHTKATDRPSYEKPLTPDVRSKLKTTWQKVDQARAEEQRLQERWDRRVNRRSEARARRHSRRQSRRPAVSEQRTKTVDA